MNIGGKGSDLHLVRLRAGSNGYPLGLGLDLKVSQRLGQPAQASAFILRRFAGSDGAQAGDEFVAADDKVFTELRCAELHEDPQSLPGADLKHALDGAPIEERRRVVFEHG